MNPKAISADRLATYRGAVMLIILSAFLLSVLPALAQVSFPNPINSGGTLPATCRPGSLVPALFVLTSGTPVTSAQTYQCTAANTWTAVPTGSGVCPSGLTGYIQFTDGTNCAGSADFTWNNTTKVLQMRGANGTAIMHLDGANTGENSYIIMPTPVSVSGASGSTGNDFSLESGNGGDTSIVSTGAGGLGGTYYIFGGNGGSAGSALTDSTGGDGGAFELLTGVGADATTAATNTGGNGGEINLSANAGGSASGGSSNTAGRGGNFFITGANGGAVTGPAMSTNVGGNAGAFEIDTGSGGSASGGSSNTGGNGSDFVIGLGAGGAGSTANGTNGSFLINGAGEVFRITRAGKVSAVDLKTTGAATGKKVVCVDTATGILYASSSGVACAN